jgi:hypothetical protein
VLPAGIKVLDDDNMMLSGALWRSVFRSDPNANTEKVIMLADYVRREVENVLRIAKEDFFHGWIPWGPVIGETVEDRLARQKRLFAGEWREAVHHDGRMYFYNTATRERQWDVPESGLYPKRRYALLKHFEKMEMDGKKLPEYIKKDLVKLVPPKKD